MRATIKMKLGVAFGLLTAMMLLVIGLGISKSNTLNDAISEIVAGPAKQLDAAEQIDTHLGYLLSNQKALALNTDQQIMAGYNADTTRRRSQFETLISEGEARASTDDKPLWRQVQQDWQTLKPVYDRISMLGTTNENAKAGELTETEQKKMVETLVKDVATIVERQRAHMHESDEATNVLYADARNLLIAVGCAATLLAAFCAIWISMLVSRGLKRVGDALDAVAIGDLDQEITVKTNDEIKDLVDTVNRMTVNCASPRRSPTRSPTVISP